MQLLDDELWETVAVTSYIQMEILYIILNVLHKIGAEKCLNSLFYDPCHLSVPSPVNMQRLCVPRQRKVFA